MRTLAETLQTRTQALVNVYAQIAAKRMQGLPFLHAKLQVQAVAFECDAAEPNLAVGILITPWFMNLLRLPLNDAAGQGMLAIGIKAERACGAHRFEFIGSHEAATGAFEAASLYSPMFEFADQAAAVATACEVLKLLRPVAAMQPVDVDLAVAAPARRGFLFGRSAVAAAR
jgi:[NiFe] hydrogenase assembly HybE family chaperone